MIEHIYKEGTYRSTARASMRHENAPPTYPWLLIVGETPGTPNGNLAHHLHPAWAITKTLNIWLGRAGFHPESARRINFRNVVPIHLHERAVSQKDVAEWTTWMDLNLQVLQPDVVMTLGRLAANAFLPVVHHLVRHAGATYQIERAGEKIEVLPFPHPSGRNRFFNDDEGREALARCIETLNERREQHDDR